MYVVRKVKVLYSYSCCYGDDGTFGKYKYRKRVTKYISISSDDGINNDNTYRYKKKNNDDNNDDDSDE